MVSAEPHIYITVPSVRIWAKNNRWAVAALVLVAVLVVLAALALLLS
ncbi:hypothetical protein H5U98_31105 [Mycolicibacterium boenickei]|uniref:Uncharacterized protein n=1 Tax=Mycolicibacterium boenickei TaxID=146017 RepID=A0AAX2ZXE2_9MYCO|nr:hypothetical protein [Mycolicibacterium boenickei]UNB99833.1 hypothetical protein H5U98_31105 [Mycolicibacterium boenickei]BBX89516.1 hypothetical protein MBOE_11650 [Mycolicibacterium boenickei]